MLKKWEDLPDFMRVPEVRPYWEILNKNRGQLFLKRRFDLFLALILLLILAKSFLSQLKKSTSFASYVPPQLHFSPT